MDEEIIITPPEEENNTNKSKNSNNKGLCVIIAILSIMLVCVTGLYVYNEFIKEDEKEDTTQTVVEDKKETNITEKETEINKSLVMDLYNSIMPYRSLNYKHLFYYKQDKLFTKDLDNYWKLYLTTLNYTSKYNDNRNSNGDFELYSTFSIDKFKEIYFNLFGKDADFKFQDVSECPRLKQESEGYKIYDQCGDMVFPAVFYSSIVKVSVTSSELYVYEKVAFLNGSSVKDGKDFFSLSSDLDGNNSIASDFTVEELRYPDKVIEKYNDKLDTYKYTFKLEDGNYYFYSVEKVK